MDDNPYLSPPVHEQPTRRAGCMPGCLVAVVVLLAAIVGGFFWLMHTIGQQREADRQWRPTNTATGYRFPALADIERIEVHVDQPTIERQVDAPEESWDEIIAALSPSEIHQGVIPAYQGIGRLRILTEQGHKTQVELWNLPEEATGAFSAGLTFEERRHYRGGNTVQLEAALETAYAAAQRQNQTDRDEP